MRATSNMETRLLARKIRFLHVPLQRTRLLQVMWISWPAFNPNGEWRERLALGIIRCIKQKTLFDPGKRGGRIGKDYGSVPYAETWFFRPNRRLFELLWSSPNTDSATMWHERCLRNPKIVSCLVSGRGRGEETRSACGGTKTQSDTEWAAWVAFPTILP
jgi:hypothetical protein